MILKNTFTASIFAVASMMLAAPVSALPMLEVNSVDGNSYFGCIGESGISTPQKAI